MYGQKGGSVDYINLIYQKIYDRNSKNKNG